MGRVFFSVLFVEGGGFFFLFLVVLFFLLFGGVDFRGGPFSARGYVVAHGVHGEEVDGGDALFAAGGEEGELGLDEPFEVGKWLGGVDEEGEGFGVFAVAVVVVDGEGEDEFEEAGGRC